MSVKQRLVNISLKHKGCVRLNNVMNNVICLFCSLTFVYVIKNMISQGDHERESVIKIGSKYARKRKRLVGPFVSPTLHPTPKAVWKPCNHPPGSWL